MWIGRGPVEKAHGVLRRWCWPDRLAPPPAGSGFEWVDHVHSKTEARTLRIPLIAHSFVLDETTSIRSRWDTRRMRCMSINFIILFLLVRSFVRLLRIVTHPRIHPKYVGIRMYVFFVDVDSSSCYNQSTNQKNISSTDRGESEIKQREQQEETKTGFKTVHSQKANAGNGQWGGRWG